MTRHSSKSVKWVLLLLVPLLLSCSAQRNAGGTSAGTSSSEGGRRSWSLSIFRGGSPMVTGLLITDVGDFQQGGIMSGTLVNEFGVRAFDFTSRRTSSGKARVRLISPSKALSNPVVKHVLKKDLGEILSSGGLLEAGEGDFPYRYGSSPAMEYVFSPSSI